MPPTVEVTTRIQRDDVRGAHRGRERCSPPRRPTEAAARWGDWRGGSGIAAAAITVEVVPNRTL
jgi:hypothetical protein